MKLTNADKELLISWGHSASDLLQIEEAIGKTKYTMNGKRISRQQAIDFLGWNVYLSGISRSAFHFTAYRETPDGDGIIFDSSTLFR